jgi:hypothetical protein
MGKQNTTKKGQPMKTLGTKLLLGNLVVMGLIGFLAGCSSTGYQKAGATSEALQVAANRITNGILQIDVTLTALTNLVNNPQGDLAPRYKKYCDDVANLRSVAADVNNKAIAMQAKGRDYFAQWEDQLATIKNQDIRQVSADQMKDMMDKFQDLSTSYQQVRMRFKPFMSNLEDIQTYLGTDLTVAGVTAIKSTADQVNDQSASLKEAITKLSDQFRQMGVSMSATTGSQ